MTKSPASLNAPRRTTTSLRKRTKSSLTPKSSPTPTPTRAYSSETLRGKSKEYARVGVGVGELFGVKELFVLFLKLVVVLLGAFKLAGDFVMPPGVELPARFNRPVVDLPYLHPRPFRIMYLG